jgi:hypothetical protein
LGPWADTARNNSKWSFGSAPIRPAEIWASVPKPLSIFFWWNTDALGESPAHRVHIGEPAGAGDSLQRLRGILQEPARGVRARRGDEIGGRHGEFTEIDGFAWRIDH